MENTSFLTGEVSIKGLLFNVHVGILVGSYLEKTGREKSALALFHECVEEVELLPPGEGREQLKGVMYFLIAIACHSLNDVKGTIEWMKMSVAIQKALPNAFPAEFTWTAYGILGNLYLLFSKFSKAIESYEEALGYVRDSIQKEQTYNYLSEMFEKLGNEKKAAEYIEKSRETLKGGATREFELKRLVCEGKLCYFRGDYRKAVACFEQALVISQEMGNKQEECGFHGLIGNAYTKMRDLQNTIQCYEVALGLAKELRREDLQVEMCINIAGYYICLENYRKAMEYFKMVPALSNLIDIPNKALLCFSIGIMHERSNDLKSAIAAYEQSFQHYEEIEENLGNNDEHKVVISDKHQHVYSYLSRALVNDKQGIKALAIAERGRTRALADLMRINYGIQTTNGPQGNLLSQNEIQQIATASGNTILVISINCWVYTWVLKPDGLITLRATMPEPIPMKSTESIKLIVHKAYDGIGVCQSEVKCEDRSLPDVYSTQAELNPREPQPTPRTSADLLWETIQREALASDPSLSSPEPRHTAGTSVTDLYDLIIAPVADLLDGSNKEDITEELVFAPDGPLCLAPFAAIQGPDGTHLCDKFRIRVIPSLTTLNHIRSCPAGYHSNTGALIVGDPSVGHVHYNGTEIHIGRLSGARKEAEMISALLKVEPLTGDKATKEEVLNRMASASLVHLAAHGHPDRGEIALAPNPSARSGIIEEKDYLLSMADVLSAKLRAKLVVLSCCHSGRGEIKAEGVVGIARVFLGAGARSVLVSLWAINDEATLYFMQHFYQHLVQGESASAALHQATRKLKNLKISEMRHWAPFLLIGDDVKISV